MKFKFPVIDSHIHMYSEADLAIMESAAKEGVYSRYTLLSSSFMPQTAAGNLSVFLAKQKHPDEVYGYASMHMPEMGAPDAKDLLSQVEQYHKMGYDGIKMIDGKPSIRSTRVPLDDSCYDPMFAYLERHQIPVLYHSNDPIEFWDINQIPLWAKDIYLYGDDIPSKNQITEETVGILKKHPLLNITIAHFFFLPNTGEYELACRLMETHPNFYMDLTPGWEMFMDFHKDFDRWKQYIVKYSERLAYGTDMNGESNLERLEPLRRLLETQEKVTVGEYTAFGLLLDDKTLKNIYALTYEKRIQKGAPAAGDLERVIAYGEEVKDRILRYHEIDQSRALKDTDRFLQLIREGENGK